MEPNIIIFSDPHLFHRKMIQWGRPEDYEERIKKNLKDYLGKNDVVICLGDICMSNDVDANNEFMKLFITNQSMLVRGNHDRKSLTFYHKYWNNVVDEFVLEYHGKRILFSHEPKPKRDDIDINIHGHLHTLSRKTSEGIDRTEALGFNYDKSYHYLISMEDNNYKPYILKSIIKKF